MLMERMLMEREIEKERERERERGGGGLAYTDKLSTDMHSH